MEETRRPKFVHQIAGSFSIRRIKHEPHLENCFAPTNHSSRFERRRSRIILITRQVPNSCRILKKKYKEVFSWNLRHAFPCYRQKCKNIILFRQDDIFIVAISAWSKIGDFGTVEQTGSENPVQLHVRNDHNSISISYT